MNAVADVSRGAPVTQGMTHYAGVKNTTQTLCDEGVLHKARRATESKWNIPALLTGHAFAIDH